MKRSQNDAAKSLLNLCRLVNIPSTRGWKTALARWLGVERVILSNWLKRGVPGHVIETVSRKGIAPSDWIAAVSAPQSTISPRPLASYEQTPEHLGPGRLRLLEKDGLHAETHHIEVGGQKIAVSTFSPDPGWIHRAVDAIMASDDHGVILAMESNVRVFLDKVKKERQLEQRIQKLEAELAREKNSRAGLTQPGGKAENFD
jgi:hypothetical protein